MSRGKSSEKESAKGLASETAFCYTDDVEGGTSRFSTSVDKYVENLLSATKPRSLDILTAQ